MDKGLSLALIPLRVVGHAMKVGARTKKLLWLLWVFPDFDDTENR